MITKPLETQNKLLYYNKMSQSLDKLELHLNKITEESKIWKIRNTVQAIEASKCDISRINVVGMFSKLTDLNIGGNFRIKSLQGI